MTDLCDVPQLSASDVDQGLNSRLLYHIVDGNPDNAFTINPPYSGIVRTNIVLDREIREKYRLTIIATDQGNPQLTGTAALSVRVIDINDNQPTFPEPKIISVHEGKISIKCFCFSLLHLHHLQLKFWLSDQVVNIAKSRLLLN